MLYKVKTKVLVKKGVRRVLKNTNLWPFFKEITGASYGNPFFTLSPDLLVALSRAFDHHKEAASSGGNNLLGRHGYYEFGLFRGFSLWFAEQLSRTCAAPDFRFYGFDSFEGLPPSDVDKDYYSEGDFSASEEEVHKFLSNYGADFDRIRLFKGFFSKEYFAHLRLREDFLPVSICVIDVDIYESCVDVLDFIHPFLVEGSILIFDDYNDMGRSDEHGERLALREFQKAHPSFKVEHLFDLGVECAGFVVKSV